jgi:cell wall-associated NlpC family hydrolase
MNKKIEAAAKEHALSQYPKESCGIVKGKKYIPIDNISLEPEKHFEMKDYPRKGLKAIIHSHPNGTASPSELDMKCQLDTAVPWGIIALPDNQHANEIEWFGDQVKPDPLLGREFLHGIRDCYALVRDYYWLEKKTRLKEFPRDDHWWHTEQKLLNPENFIAAGFKEIESSQLQKGDVILCAILTRVVNHCGIYLGDGLVMHHLYDRLSRRQPLLPWMKHCRYFLRYVG